MISVCLYIHILAAFLLGGLGVNTPRRENILIANHRSHWRAGLVSRLDMLLVMERWALV
jgi:hypothetical protein